MTATGTTWMHAVGGSDVAGGGGAGGGGAGGMSPQRRTFVSPTTEGDQRHLFGQGRPMAKDAVNAATRGATLRAAAGRRVLARGGVANRYQGTLSAAQNANQNQVESRLFFTGTTGMSGGLDLSRCTDAREKERLGIFGTAESYAGSYGRVTSESIGRDLNPLGRGDGMAYVGGDLNLLQIAPPYPQGITRIGFGSSVNNGCQNDQKCSAEVLAERYGWGSGPPLGGRGVEPEPPHYKPEKPKPPSGGNGDPTKLMSCWTCCKRYYDYSKGDWEYYMYTPRECLRCKCGGKSGKNPRAIPVDQWARILVPEKKWDGESEWVKVAAAYAAWVAAMLALLLMIGSILAPLAPIVVAV